MLTLDRQDFALIDPHMCADQPVTLTFRLRQGGPNHIFRVAPALGDAFLKRNP
jgi:hypothetical protein